MPSIVEQLKDLKQVKPNKDWVDSQRNLLLSQIKQQSAAKPQSVFVNSWYLFKSVLPGSFLKFVARPVGVLTVMILFVFGTGMFGVNASKGSIPGDILYPVKLTSEKVKVGFTVAGEKQAELHVQFAEERVKEIEKVVKSGSEPENKKQKIKVSADGLTSEMKKAQIQLDKVKQEPKKAQEVIAVAKKVDEKTDEIGEKLEQQKLELNEGDDKELGKSLDEAGEATAETGVKAIEVIVEKHEQGDVELSENDLVETIEKKLNKAEEKVKESVAQIKSVTENVAYAGKVKQDKQDQAELDAENEAVLEGETGEEGTEEGDQGEVETTEETAEETNENNLQKVDEIKDKPGEAEQKLTEAKDLLSQGDLTNALEKIRESSTLTTEVREGVENIEDDLPAVEEVETESEVEASAVEQTEVEDSETEETSSL